MQTQRKWSTVSCIYIQTHVNVATAKRSMNEGQPKQVPCPLVSGVCWIMWWGSPWGAGDLATGPYDTCAGRLYRAQSPVDLFSRAKPAATARGLEVSVSRSGPPQPTDSEQQGQLWGCRTPLLCKALGQKHISKHDKELRLKKKGKLFHKDYGCFQHGKQAGILSKSHSLNIQVDFHKHNVVGYLMWPTLWFVYLSETSFSRSVM